jgi:hypothetical protein
MKDLMIQQESQGWSFIGDKFVCTKCVDDYALARFIRDNAVEKHCDYCGRTSKSKTIAAPIDDVMVEISQGIYSEWRHPDNVGVPYESAEGGYQGTVIDSYDLINDELWDVFLNENLRQDIIDAFDSQGAMWCDRHFWTLPPQEALWYGWEEFTKVVKHTVRYLITRAPDYDSEYRGYEEIPPHMFLDRLGNVVEESGIITSLPRGAPLFRARVHKRAETLRSAAQLGPPPIDKAIYSNRMSPAGIPMFYGAFDKKTATMETYDSLSDLEYVVTTAVFETARDFPVLDLTRLPKLPSIFDSEERDRRPGIIFLQNFTKDLSKQIEKDGREHIEYIPTQVVTEYFHHIFKSEESGNLKGILYPSAQRPGGKCCVLFLRSEDCCDITPGWASVTKEFKSDAPQFWLGLDTKSVELFDPTNRCNKRTIARSKQKNISLKRQSNTSKGGVT